MTFTKKSQHIQFQPVITAHVTVAITKVRVFQNTMPYGLVEIYCHHFKMSVDIYQIMQHHIPETNTLKTGEFWL
jgi:hypothetical protein